MRTRARNRSSEPTDFDCLLSISLLKLGIVGINCDAELCSIKVNQIIRVHRDYSAYQFVIFSLYGRHEEGKENSRSRATAEIGR